MTPKYQVGGLASGIDTMSIIDQFVALQQQPIKKVQQRQSDTKTQISVLGSLASKLSALESAAKELSTNGLRATKISSTNSSFSVTSDTSALPGSYSIEVVSTARAAKAKSQQFASATAQVAGGTLGLSIQGTAYSIAIDDGTSLSDVAKKINASGAPINASIINTSTGSFLSLVNRNTGYQPGQPASSALEITETTTGSTGQPLAAAIYEAADNAQIVIDGQADLTVERADNTFSNVLPGVTITAKTAAAAETLAIASDEAASQARMQTFISGVKTVTDYIDAAMTNTKEKKGPLAGDSSLRSIKNSIGRLVSQTVSGAGAYSSLSDLGLTHDRYGALSFDSLKFNKALSNDPTSANALFPATTSGIYASVQSIVKQATDSTNGTLVTRQSSLNKTIKRYDDQIENMQRSADNYRAQLTQQFSSMESVMSKLKATGNFLTQQEKAASAGKN